MLLTGACAIIQAQLFMTQKETPMKRSLIPLIIAVLTTSLWGSVGDYTGYITATKGDSTAQSGTVADTCFTNKTHWSDGLQPSSGKRYYTNGKGLIAPTAGGRVTFDDGTTGKLRVFRGECLAVGGGGYLAFRATTEEDPIVFPNDGLILDQKSVLRNWAGSGRHTHIAGRITVVAPEGQTVDDCASYDCLANYDGITAHISADLFSDSTAYFSVHAQPGLSKENYDIYLAKAPFYVELSGDNAGYFGAIAIERYAVLSLKSSLANATVLVGHRGWPFTPVDPDSGDAGTLCSTGASSVVVGKVVVGGGTVCVAASSVLSIGELELNGAVLRPDFDAAHGACGKIAVTEKLTVNRLPVRIRLNADPVGRHEVLSWPVGDSTNLTLSDFDFGDTLKGAVPEMLVSCGIASLVLDSTEVTMTKNDGNNDSAFTEAKNWSDTAIPHGDARYSANGKQLVTPRNYVADFQYADGPAPNTTFHGKRLHLPPSSLLCLCFPAGSADGVTFPNEGLLMDGGSIRLWSTDRTKVNGTIRVLSGESGQSGSRAGVDGSANKVHKGVEIAASLRGRSEAAFYVSYQPSLPAGYMDYEIPFRFSGENSCYLGKIIAEPGMTVFLNSALVNGTLQLGGTGYPKAALESLDSGKNGVLTTETPGVVAISNLVVNGGSVNVPAASAFALQSLTLNGGFVRLAAGETDTPALGIAGTVSVTHLTTVTIPARPKKRQAILSASASSALNAADFTLTGSSGETLRDVELQVVEESGRKTLFAVRIPRGMVLIFR